MSVTCGYYPISIGYYTPSNRLSVIWTNPAQDLQIWDSSGESAFTPLMRSLSTGQAAPW